MLNLQIELFRRLERWYESQCNGDWEHRHGITIETVDNMGGTSKRSLRVHMCDRAFEEIHENQGDDRNEFLCRVKDQVFVGQSPPNRLHEVISIFLGWAQRA
ncbi:Imm53 family immunity protein [Bradyrhizobium sp. LB11.1]|uniref:Imm53 family immunity protein n=1 Tax=Bradyrhizobium sp. LB11.1 TaxID=3156326 RepID=UPI00339A1036